MDTVTLIAGGILGLLLAGFLIRLCYTIMLNLINGRKFHDSLEQQFNQLRLSKMLTALGINKTSYIYQTSVNDIQKQMDSCSACENTDQCDEKLENQQVSISDIDYCNNESDLIEMKLRQSEVSQSGRDEKP